MSVLYTPECQAVLSICRKHALPKNGKIFLGWHQGGLPALQRTDLALLFIMELHGYTPMMVVCDGVLDVCTGLHNDSFKSDTIFADQKKKYCDFCRETSLATLKACGIPYVLLSSLLRNIDVEKIRQNVGSDLKQIQHMRLKDADLGIALQDALLHFYNGMTEESYDPEMVRKFATATYCNYIAAKEALARYHPYRILIVHCAYSDHKPPFDVFIANNVPVVTYAANFLKDSIQVNTINTYGQNSNRKICDSQWKQICQEPISDKERELFQNFFDVRYRQRGHADRQRVSSSTIVSKEELADALSLDKRKKTFLMPLHMNFDISSAMSNGFFSSYNELALSTVRELCSLDEAQWLLKVHPAPKGLEEASSTQEIILREFPHLPEHIRLIPADVPYSPLSFFDLCDGAVDSSGTSGIEMAALGKNVLQSCKGFYWGRGFTLDPQNFDEFKAMLHNLPHMSQPSADQTEAARRYLMTYFYRMSLSLPNYRHSTFDFDSADGFIEYIPGRNETIQYIMDSVEKCQMALRPWSSF